MFTWLLAETDYSALTSLGPIQFGTSIFTYLFLAICTYTIAQKLRAENGWLAFIPIANVFYITSLAKKPVWWPILAIIPCVNIVWLFVLFPMTLVALAEERGKSGLMGCLLWIPFVNWFVLAYLAFSD